MKKTVRQRIAVLTAGCLCMMLPTGFCAELTLEQAVQLALENNYDVKIAHTEEEAAVQALRKAQGQNKYSVSASTSLSIADENSSGFNKGNTNRVSLSMPLYSGGKNELTIDKAKDETRAARLSFERTLEDTRLSTVTAYYEILEAKKVIEVDEETVNNYQKHLNDVSQLYNAGSSPKVDVLRSEVELSNARQTLIKDRNTYEVAQTSLRNIIKLKNREELKLLDDAPYVKFSKSLDECIAAARVCRKDLAKEQIAVEQAEKDVEIAKSGKKMSLDLSVANSWDKQLVFSKKHHNLSAGVTASWNLFDSHITDAEIKTAEIALLKAKLNYSKQADSIEKSVEEYYLSMREAEERFNSTQTAIRQADEDYYIASEKYRAGAGTMLDIVDAQLALTTAKKNYISAQYDYVTSKAKLENAMGAE